VACENEQRLTKDVTPSPRLEDLLQGLRMPGRASWNNSLVTIHHPRVPLRVDPPSQVSVM
jgi:hypothetical protein